MSGKICTSPSYPTPTSPPLSTTSALIVDKDDNKRANGRTAMSQDAAQTANGTPAQSPLKQQHAPHVLKPVADVAAVAGEDALGRVDISDQSQASATADTMHASASQSLSPSRTRDASVESSGGLIVSSVDTRHPRDSALVTSGDTASTAPARTYMTTHENKSDTKLAVAAGPIDASGAFELASTVASRTPLDGKPLARPMSPSRTLSHLKREASASTAPSPAPVASTSGSASPSSRASHSPPPSRRFVKEDDSEYDIKQVKQEQNDEPDRSESDMDMSDQESTASPRKTSSGDRRTGSTPARARAKKSKQPTPEPQLIPDLPKAETEALATYVDIPECTYASKALGDMAYFDVDSSRCDCSHWPGDPIPCGENSNCVNRLMQIECAMNECRCGDRCFNQRFQRKEYAPIDIVKTKKKGFGVRAKEDMSADTFIYEYVGEVIGPDAFARRMKQYAASGIRHFYFMALDRDVFIDATKKGGKGRFLNHSCNPNCVVAKWTIGKKMHMGIFAKRDIKQNEELTFNYNVDRYGHEAQECYCGEPNCVGYIGGKTQTDIGGMDELYLDALGIAEEVEALNLRGTKKKKGKKLDEDFWPDLKPIRLEEVPKVSAAVRQSIQTRRILQKLLTRIQMTTDLEVRKALLRLHGFNVMNHIFKEYPNDKEIITLDLEILSGWDLQQRNKVESSGIEEPVKKCAAMSDARIQEMAKQLLNYWDSLELGYRIPRSAKEAGEDADRKRAAEYSIDHIFKRARTDAEDAADVPEFIKPSAVAPPPRTKTAPTLPAGWVQHRNEKGKIFFVNSFTNERQWIYPSAPATPGPSSVKTTPSAAVDVNDIIAKATAEAAAKEAARLEEEQRLAKEREDEQKRRGKKKAQTAQVADSMSGKDKKIMGLFSTVVVQVMSKYKEHFDSDQFKKRAREVTLLLVDKERKHPLYATDSYESLSAEKAAKVKSFTKEWTKKLIERKRAHTGSGSTPGGGGTDTPKNGNHSAGTPSMIATPSPSTPSASASAIPPAPSTSSAQRPTPRSSLNGDRSGRLSEAFSSSYKRRSSYEDSPSMSTPQTPLVAPRDVRPVSSVGQGLDSRDRALVREMVNGRSGGRDSPRSNSDTSFRQSDTPSWRRWGR
ncbi:histone methyltransferase set2 [Microbotryomycetes sp. JL201]|nr:histone methyltransferase set2 [Microbotryomycetes sp. JL201]